MTTHDETTQAAAPVLPITQLQATPNIEVRLHTQVVDGHGYARLETLTLEDVRTGRLDQHKATAVFVMIGAEPHTDWLRGVLELDDRGFVLAGRDLPEPAWPLQRAPLPFETSLPGVFAAGDVRYGSVKRVAGAAGEGVMENDRRSACSLVVRVRENVHPWPRGSPPCLDHLEEAF